MSLNRWSLDNLLARPGKISKLKVKTANISAFQAEGSVLGECATSVNVVLTRAQASRLRNNETESACNNLTTATNILACIEFESDDSLELFNNSTESSTSNMAEGNDRVKPKIPRAQPEKFAEKESEDVKEFLDQYNRIGEINYWQDIDKLRLISVYLTGNALRHHRNIEKTGLLTNCTWVEFQNILISEYHKVRDLDELYRQMTQRRYKCNETIGAYITDKEMLCKEHMPEMTEKNQIGYIIRGLPLDIGKVSLMSNNTITELRTNIEIVKQRNQIMDDESERIKGNMSESSNNKIRIDVSEIRAYYTQTL